MNQSPIETRIKLKTSFQDSYLEDRPLKTDPRVISTLSNEIREAEFELDLQKATQNFLLTQFTVKKHKKSKDELIPAAINYLESALSYEQSLKKMKELDKHNIH